MKMKEELSPETTADAKQASSDVDVIAINPINEKYRNMEDIKSYLDVIKQVRESDDEHAKNAFQIFNYPRGKKLQLTVEVDDPDLVNAILTSEWGSEGLMPGMNVRDVRFSDLERKDVIVDWLQNQLSELEEKIL